MTTEPREAPAMSELLADLLDYSDGYALRRLDHERNVALVSDWSKTPRGQALLAENERLRAALYRIAMDMNHSPDNHHDDGDPEFPYCGPCEAHRVRAALEGATDGR